jgi:hypothetical protein
MLYIVISRLKLFKNEHFPLGSTVKRITYYTKRKRLEEKPKRAAAVTTSGKISETFAVPVSR